LYLRVPGVRSRRPRPWVSERILLPQIEVSRTHVNKRKDRY